MCIIIGNRLKLLLFFLEGGYKGYKSYKNDIKYFLNLR